MMKCVRCSGQVYLSHTQCKLHLISDTKRIKERYHSKSSKLCKKSGCKDLRKQDRTLCETHLKYYRDMMNELNRRKRRLLESITK